MARCSEDALRSYGPSAKPSRELATYMAGIFNFSPGLGDHNPRLDVFSEAAPYVLAGIDNSVLRRRLGAIQAKLSTRALQPRKAREAKGA